MPHTPAADPRWPHPVRGVAFDLDGLMFDTEPLYYVAGCRLMERRGKSFRDEVRRQMMGRPGPVAMQVLIEAESLEADTVAGLLSECDELMLELMAQPPSMMPGLVQFLDRLRDRKLPFGVATSSRRRLAEHLLRGAGLFDELHFLLCGEDVVHGKPHPEVYRRAARQLGITEAQMLVLEDSGNGATAGVASGACTVAVPGDHSRDHDFPAVHLIAETLADPRLTKLIE
jgi:HAD superfamily hydrolase (TIGR01509 family)